MLLLEDEIDGLLFDFQSIYSCTYKELQAYIQKIDTYWLRTYLIVFLEEFFLSSANTILEITEVATWTLIMF